MCCARVVHRTAPAAFSAGFRRCARMRTDTFCAASPKLGSANTCLTPSRSPSAVICPAQQDLPRFSRRAFLCLNIMLTRSCAGGDAMCCSCVTTSQGESAVQKSPRCRIGTSDQVSQGNDGVSEATLRDHEAKAAVDSLHHVVRLVAKDRNAHNWHAMECGLPKVTKQDSVDVKVSREHKSEEPAVCRSECSICSSLHSVRAMSRTVPTS